MAIYTKTIKLSEHEIATYKSCEELTGEECYDLYGLKEDETFIKSVTFDNGFMADIKQVIPCWDSTVWHEMVLFNTEGSEVACSDVSETFFGEWELEDRDGNIYRVNVPCE